MFVLAADLFVFVVELRRERGLTEGRVRRRRRRRRRRGGGWMGR